MDVGETKGRQIGSHGGGPLVPGVSGFHPWNAEVVSMPSELECWFARPAVLVSSPCLHMYT